MRKSVLAVVALALLAAGLVSGTALAGDEGHVLIMSMNRTIMR